MSATSSEEEWSVEYERTVDANPPPEDYDPLKEDIAAKERNLRKTLHQIGKKGRRV